MDGPIFSLNRHQSKTHIKILSWNANGIKTKLEKLPLQEKLHEYDIVAINEVKTNLNICLPGFTTHRTTTNQHSSRRGGTVVLLKNWLVEHVYNVDTSSTDAIWLKLKILPNVSFAFLYIPPADSIYFNLGMISAIQERLMDRSNNDNICIVGDLNTRFGVSLQELPSQSGIPRSHEYIYPIIHDRIDRPNENARLLSTTCREHQLVVLNNLLHIPSSKHFQGNFTFRRARNWVSELDCVIASYQLIPACESFTVIHEEVFKSDHAPIQLCLSIPAISTDVLLKRSAELGSHRHYERKEETCRSKKALRVTHQQISNLSELLSHTQAPTLSDDLDRTSLALTDALYELTSSITAPADDHAPLPPARRPVEDRWRRLVEEQDAKKVWSAINWKGKLEEKQTSERPTDDQFKVFYESRNPTINSDGDEVQHPDIYIPVLDDQITVDEVTSQLRKMKGNKASGPDGIPANALKSLPAVWITFLTTLFNNIFFSATYPGSWTTAKLTTIFKKGNRLVPENYRGISVVNSIAKLYDMILCARFEHWYKPHREQAGAQRGRGCLEHILTLRLMSDYARRKKKLLYITYVDFSSAYDLIPRTLLFKVLKSLGCGAVFLGAIAATYNTTQSLLGTAIITTMCGVRQGMPSSCPLFLAYVHNLIKMIKETFEPESFLGWLHILMLMDDTVLLATSREQMINKIKILNAYCKTYGMVINLVKTNFMVINGSAEDRRDIHVDDLTIRHTQQYVYLGSIFTSDGNISTAVAEQMKAKMKDFNKFISFINKNNDIPFSIKRKVFDAAFSSSILYSCESWFNADLKPVAKLYNNAIKHMLGVRYNSCTDLCLHEAGFSPVEALVKERQRTLLKKLWQSRRDMVDDPFAHTMRLVTSSRYVTSTYINGLLTSQNQIINEAKTALRAGIEVSVSSRRTTYRDVTNTLLKTCELYTSAHNVPEERRISYTRFRVISHSLAVETGRWNRRGRGRLPLEERLCPCGAVQTEEHVVVHCPLSQDLRRIHRIFTIEELNSEIISSERKCNFIYELLNLYK